MRLSERLRCVLTATLWPTVVQALLSATTFAAEPGFANCAHPTTGFDGIQALKYATVISGEPVALHTVFPGTTNPDPDSGKPAQNGRSVPPGSPVAIGGTCEQWSYVQYIGAQTVAKGWVESARLTPLPASLPFDAGTPAQGPDGTYSQQWQIHVALVKGRGVPVCEAYLQRLNQTLFYQPPFCGRPENDGIPGFTLLHAKEFSGPGLNRILQEVLHIRGYGVPAAKLSEPAPPLREGDNAPVWTYDPRVDIDNDGTPDNVIIYVGQNLSECGVATNTWPHGSSTVPEPFILTADNAHIDFARTVALFGTPGVLSPPANGVGASATVPYEPLGYSISFFRYRDTYYFDAFAGNWAPLDAPAVTARQFISVYRRDKDRLDEVCRVKNIDSEWRLL